MRVKQWITIVAGVILWCAGPALAASPPLAVSQDIRTLTGTASAAVLDGETILIRDVADVYRALGYEPLWAGPGTEERTERLQAALADAAAHGFNVDDLHFQKLRLVPTTATSAEAAARDVLLTDAFLRYSAKLRRGAAPVEALGADWGIAQPPFVASTALIEAIRAGRFVDLLESLQPSVRQYRQLMGALQLYGYYAARGGWPTIPASGEVRLSADEPRLSVLRQRLHDEDWIASTDAAPNELAAAVRLFQLRHGLDPDGRIGQKTLAELNISAAQRVAQIAANLERWRHLPHRFGAEFAMVNAADATVEFVQDGALALHMRVIVGDPKHPTPVLNAQISAVTFNPPWNVPVSIATKEILPRMRRDPGYLAANQIEIVNRPQDPYGLGIDWRRISRANFPFQFQQRPGPKNSLGLIKLEMPNRFDVYLHDTPAKGLFNRPGRAFSHGCIRLERAADFAERLLDQPQWTAAAIQDAIADGETHQVRLTRPVPVYVLYLTAFVDDAGGVNFRSDIYGRDTAIARALGPITAPQAKPAVTPVTAEIGCSGPPVRAAG